MHPCPKAMSKKKGKGRNSAKENEEHKSFFNKKYHG
jgi:hypothetical protein